MTHRQEVLGFLNKIAPQAASNSEIVSHTRIKPHQQIFQLTKRLMDEGSITGRREGREWYFSAEKEVANRSKRRPTRKAKSSAVNGGSLNPSEFEQLCQRVMSDHFGANLNPAKLKGVHKRFDLVSEDGQIVGDAKYYTAVNGRGLPPAKFATIAEYVWLLEKTSAKRRFLVFGNDRRVPEWWLDRYGNLTEVEFYYASDTGVLGVCRS